MAADQCITTLSHHIGGHMLDIPLKCKCGSFQGTASQRNASSCVRVVCYCTDCQAYAKYLGDENSILDEFGGTDVCIMPPAHLKINSGLEQLRCVQLTVNGPYRWYTECCKTPVGNCVNLSMPAMTLSHRIMDDGGRRDQLVGSIAGYMYGKEAIGNIPKERIRSIPPIGMAMNLVVKLISWKIQGKNRPNPFFDQNGSPVSPPLIMAN